MVDHNIGVGCEEPSQLLASDPMLEAIQSGKEDGRSQPLESRGRKQSGGRVGRRWDRRGERGVTLGHEGSGMDI